MAATCNSRAVQIYFDVVLFDAEMHDPLNLDEQARMKADAATRKRIKEENESKDIVWLMKQKPGRRVVWSLLEKSGVFRSSFNTNALQMAFNEGWRNQGNELLARINELCPEQYEVMVREAQERRNDVGSGAKSN